MSRQLWWSRRRAWQPFKHIISPVHLRLSIRFLFTSAIRRMFSSRSFGENPRSLFSPNLTLSPSSLYVCLPRWRRCCSRAVAMVDFPEAERPVNQTVHPFCLRSSLRSLRVRPACHVMFLETCQDSSYGTRAPLRL